MNKQLADIELRNEVYIEYDKYVRSQYKSDTDIFKEILRNYEIRHRPNRDVQNLLALLDQVRDFITEYGGYDGGHHKQWVLDQVIRMITSDYDAWLKEYKDGEDGPETYEWDEGIAP